MDRYFVRFRLKLIFKFLDNKWFFLVDFEKENIRQYVKFFTFGLYIWDYIYQFGGNILWCFGCFFVVLGEKRIYVLLFIIVKLKSYQG